MRKMDLGSSERLPVGDLVNTRESEAAVAAALRGNRRCPGISFAEESRSILTHLINQVGERNSSG